MEAVGIIEDGFLGEAVDITKITKEQCLKLLELSQDLEGTVQPEVQDEQQVLVSYEQKLLNSYLARLRGLNRVAVHRMRQTKQDTAEARAEVDTLHLQLQNLYYEQRHLRGEIAACESYDHKYQSLPLISLEEFLPDRPDLQNTDESTLMEARINHEHAERESLEQRRQGLLKKKQRLIAENKKRKDDLASLDQDLEKFIDAARPIQKIFEKEY